MTFTAVASGRYAGCEVAAAVTTRFLLLLVFVEFSSFSFLLLFFAFQQRVGLLFLNSVGALIEDAFPFNHLKRQRTSH